MPNCAAWAEAALSLARIGAVVVPLSTLLRPPELELQLRTAAVERLVVAPEFRGRRYLDDLRSISPELVPRAEPIFDRTLRRLRSIVVWPEWAAGPPPETDPALVDAMAAAVCPADDLAVIFTSGSRGTPKG